MKIIAAVEISEVEKEKAENALAKVNESIGKQIDEFLKKLEELKENTPNTVEVKEPILCEETRVTLVYLTKINAFLKLLDELTEKMKPYREHYPSLAAVYDQFHKGCAKSIKEMEVKYF
jgi:hypothetical protein